jgi:iron complex outermembrane receptor protein
MRPPVLLLACAAFASVPAIAQEARGLHEVVVTGTRRADDALVVPAAIDRIDAADLARARPQLQLSESLQRVPGVVVRDRQNQAQDLQVSIRGFGARATFGVRGVRLYTDGIPATMPDGQGQVSHFAIEAADHIEVLRGPFSALYGNASGGVIEVSSALPPDRLEAAFGFVAGADGLQRASASLRGPLAATAGFRVDGGRVDGDGFRRHSASRRAGAQALLRGDNGATRYTLIANTLDLSAQDPQGLTRAELAIDRRASSPNALRFDTRKRVGQQHAGARLEHDVGDAQQLALLVYAGRRQTAQVLSVPVAAQASATSGGGAIDLDRAYRGTDLRWSVERGAWTLVAGSAVEVSDERRRGFENFVGQRLGVVGALRRDEDDRVDAFDQYLQVGWQPAPRWHVNAGARHSRVHFDTADRYVRAGNPDDSGGRDYSATSPVLGVLWRATPWLSLYGNAGRGFETPTFAELAYRGDGASGLNTALEAARSRNVELGMRARGPRHAVSAALFHTRTRAELVVASNQGGRSVFANAGMSRRRGFELAASGDLAARWHYAASYTWLDARFDNGMRIPGLSRHAGWAELRWSPRERLDVMLEARATDRVLADDANTAAAPGHAVLDLAIERRFRLGAFELRGWGRLQNLLDRDVVGSVIVNDANARYFEPAPGRGWQAGVTVVRLLR